MMHTEPDVNKTREGRAEKPDYVGLFIIVFLCSSFRYSVQKAIRHVVIDFMEQNRTWRLLHVLCIPLGQLSVSEIASLLIIPEQSVMHVTPLVDV